MEDLQQSFRRSVLTHNTSNLMTQCVNQIPPCVPSKSCSLSFSLYFSLSVSLTLSFCLSSSLFLALLSHSIPLAHPFLFFRHVGGGRPFWMQPPPSPTPPPPDISIGTISRKVGRLGWYMTFLTVIIITVCAAARRQTVLCLCINTRH